MWEGEREGKPSPHRAWRAEPGGLHRAFWSMHHVLCCKQNFTQAITTRFELKSDLLCNWDGVQFVDLLWFCRNISMKNSYLLFCGCTIKQHHNQNILWQHWGRVSVRMCPWKVCHVWKTWTYMPYFEFFKKVFPFHFFILYWSIVDLQRCISFWCTAKWVRYVSVCLPHYRLVQDIGLCAI